MNAKLVFSLVLLALISTATFATPERGSEEADRHEDPYPTAADCWHFDPTGHYNLLLTLPSNVCLLAKTSVVSFGCDEVGNESVRDGKFVCVKYGNSTQRFIAVYAGEQPTNQMGPSKILLVAEKDNDTNVWKQRQQLWARGQDTAVTWMSEQASRHYTANNGDPNQVITVDGPTQKQTPTVQQSPPVQRALADCNKFRITQIVERFKCEVANKAVIGQ